MVKLATGYLLSAAAMSGLPIHCLSMLIGLDVKWYPSTTGVLYMYKMSQANNSIYHNIIPS